MKAERHFTELDPSVLDRAKRLVCRLFGHDELFIHHMETCVCTPACRGTYRIDDAIICRRCGKRLWLPPSRDMRDVGPLVLDDHEHQWVPWAEIYGIGEGEKVFSNGRGCRICRIRERA